MKKIIIILILVNTKVFAFNNKLIDSIFVFNNKIEKSIEFNNYITVYKSPKNYNITEVLKKIKSGEIEKTSTKASRGFNTDYYWIFFKFENKTNNEISFVLRNGTPNIDKANLYLLSKNKINSLYKTGKNIKFKDRSISSNLIYFPIKIKANSTSGLYILKLEKINKSLSFPLYIENTEYFKTSSNHKRIFHFIYFALLFVFIIISISLGIMLKYRVLTLYGLYILSLSFFFFHYKAYASEFLFPENPVFNSYLDGIVVLILISFTQFSIEFLEIKKNYKPAHIFINIVGIVSAFLFVFISFNILNIKVYAYKLFYYISVIILISFPYILYKIYNKNKQQVIMFIIALAFIILGTLTTMLIGLGFFSAKLLKYDLMITGSFIEVLIFLFAIIYKMFQQEKNRRSLLLKEAKMQEDLLQAYLTGSKKSSRKIVNELNIDVINKLENIKKGILTKNTDELKENISEVYNDVRRISHQLSPQALKIKGLKQSLISLVSENKQKSNIDISIGFLDFIDIFDKRGLYIIRVMQEALENAIKHSKCTDITIEIIGHEDETVYTIDDNGIGFDISKLDYKNGLLNMQTRIEVIGGFFEISSSPNNGTNIFFSIPLDYEETEQD